MKLDPGKSYYLAHPLTSVGSIDYNYKSESMCYTETIMNNNAARIVRPLKCLPDARMVDVDQKTAMEKCIALLQVCEGIILCPGWESSKGCQEEFKYAKDTMRHFEIITMYERHYDSEGRRNALR